MELLELQELLGNPEELVKKIQATKNLATIASYRAQYDPLQHAIIDKAKRPDKVVEADGGTTSVAVARLPIPMQKQIVDRAAAFLCGNPIKLISTPADDLQKSMVQLVLKTWDDNKLDYDSKKLAKLMMSETEVAELWYTEPVNPLENYWMGTVNEGKAQFRLRMKVIANKFGDALYPIYNNAGDMIGFARGYTLTVGDKKEEHFDLYTDLTTYKLTKQEGWDVLQEANMIGKIPVIYYSQELPEWSDVQALIERLETLASNHADTNDYFVSPMVFLEGEIEGFAKKGEQGKVIQGKNGAKASYLTWDQSPESLKLEYMHLMELIRDMTDTPPINLEAMKGLGVFSGIALKMLFLGPHLKAADKEETFGKGIQRRINFIKAALAKINVNMEAATPMKIAPKFEYYLPKNDEEMVTILSTATGGQATISRRSAVANNPFVTDVDAELALMDQDGLDTEVEGGI